MKRLMIMAGAVLVFATAPLFPQMEMHGHGGDTAMMDRMHRDSMMQTMMKDSAMMRMMMDRMVSDSSMRSMMMDRMMMHVEGDTTAMAQMCMTMMKNGEMHRMMKMMSCGDDDASATPKSGTKGTTNKRTPTPVAPKSSNDEHSGHH